MSLLDPAFKFALTSLKARSGLNREQT